MPARHFDPQSRERAAQALRPSARTTAAAAAAVGANTLPMVGGTLVETGVDLERAVVVYGYLRCETACYDDGDVKLTHGATLKSASQTVIRVCVTDSSTYGASCL